MKTKITKSRTLLLGAILAFATPFALPTAGRAADHGDGPSASLDRACDIGDIYFFMDPGSTTKVVILATVQGFIVPSEAGNFGVFDPNVRYQFQIENNGDALLDKTISVFFNPRVAPTSIPQSARIVFSGDATVYTANATNPTLAGTANTQTVTTLANGVEFFAGEVDDPFFFDIVGFNRFVAKQTATPRDPTAGAELARARDSFAGYNTLCIGLRVPIALLKAAGSTSTKLGLDFVTQRRLVETPSLVGTTLASGAFRNIDRTGNPAVNVALIPFAKKNRYNASTPAQDKANLFAPDIIATLTALGASSTAIGTLAGVAVAQGDILRLDTAVANTGNGGGTNLGAGFPNGRRLQDDVIDTILSIIAGGTLGDGANANDVPFQNVFPYVALPQQPRANGITDDNTRN